MPKEVRYNETGQSLLIKALGYSPKLRITEMSLQMGKREAEKIFAVTR